MILTLSGGPASGKSKILEELLKKHDVKLVPSYTTRSPRIGQLPGEYVHIRESNFEAFKRRGDFAWTREFRGHLYGTRANDLVQALDSNKFWIMILLPDVVVELRRIAKARNSRIRLRALHICAPPIELWGRLRDRGLPQRKIEEEYQRYHTLHDECIRSNGLFDASIVNRNDMLEETMREVEMHLV